MPHRVWIESAPLKKTSTPAQTSVSDTAALVLAANDKRKGLVIQNTGTTIIKLSLGTTDPTATVYAVALQACTAANDGKGGAYFDDAWTGPIRAISSAAGGTIVITEFELGSAEWDTSGTRTT